MDDPSFLLTEEFIAFSGKIKTIYENNWIEVEHHEVLNPIGNDGIYGKVHFKNLAIGIIPLDENNNTWLVGQYR